MDLQQQIAELRQKFFKKIDEEGASANFHPNDLNRAKTQDDWLQRFLVHSEYKINEAVNMMWTSCEWRKNVGANDITEENVKQEILEEGIFFPYGKDKDGKTLFVIKCKLYVKGVRDTAELQRCVIYWLERLEREGNGDQITIFFDLTDSGLSNLDTDFIRYIVNLLKNYYPNFLNNIILLELPWVLNAILKIIKTWLPPQAIPKIKQVNKAGLKEFVDSDVALKSWGGTSDFVFKFTPEIRNNTIDNENGKLDNKKVHFAEGSPLNEQAPSNFGEQSFEETMLSIIPEVISFNKEGQEVVGTLQLKNQTTDKCLSYKIKTTAPEKFRVRKSNGVLLPGQQITVTVSLQPGFNLRSLLHNKFLVMCLPMKDSKMTAEDLTEFWKTNGNSAEQHRVWCREGGTETGSILSSSTISNDRVSDNLYAKIAHLEECHTKLHKDLRTLKHVMIVSIIWTVIAAITIIYILRSDIENVLGSEQSCHMHRE
ncbi:motile sperm domain-containing protein 2-like [Chelonus insularis]|uniref:motile sperm domain-containing protein 2-like n=1 Tax=Chelonus insularis TaxID=460826 RepID=UPI00158E27F8|nr:motile sperm domain-containing protein 2-like [Chelonus insularis]